MKTNITLLLLFLKISITFSQEKTIAKFNFNPENSSQVSKEIYSPEVYKISKKNITLKLFDTVQIKTAKYIEYAEMIEEMKNDSIKRGYAESSLKKYRQYLKDTKKFEINFVEKGDIVLEGYTKGEEIDFKTLSGNYIKIDSLYSKTIYQGNQSEKVFVNIKDAKNLNIKENKLTIETDFILQNENTKELYYGNSYLTGNFASNNEISDILNSKGFSTKKIGREFYIIFGSKKIKIDSTIKEKIKQNDFNFITELVKSIDKYSSLAIQSKPIFEKLSNHINAYQSKTLTKERLSQWKKDNLKGQEIVKQFEILFNLQSDIYYLDAQVVGIENSKAYTNITNAVLVSNKFIGM